MAAVIGAQRQGIPRISQKPQKPPNHNKNYFYNTIQPKKYFCGNLLKTFK